VSLYGGGRFFEYLRINALQLNGSPYLAFVCPQHSIGSLVPAVSVGCLPSKSEKNGVRKNAVHGRDSGAKLLAELSPPAAVPTPQGVEKW